ELLGQLELGADAVGAGDQDRLAILAGEVEQRAEPAQPAHHLGAETAPDQRLDALDHFVARIDVDAGVAIGEGSARRRRGRGRGCGTFVTGFRPGATMPATTTSERNSAWPRRAWRACLVACLLLAVAGHAMAQRVEGDRAAAEGIYQAEVQVRSQAADERDRGLARALSQVLTKLSGDRRVAERPGIAGELRRAGDKVASYDYRQDERRSPTTGAPIYTTTLIVRFDPDRIDDIAAALGVPVWPQPRPKPVLWLAIDDGSGPRLVDVGSAVAARSALERALVCVVRMVVHGGR